MLRLHLLCVLLWTPLVSSTSAAEGALLRGSSSSTSADTNNDGISQQKANNNGGSDDDNDDGNNVYRSLATKNDDVYADVAWCGSILCKPSRGVCMFDEAIREEFCACKEGWTGPNCMDDFDECNNLDPKPCSFPGGYCVNHKVDDGMYGCGCDVKDGHWRNGTTFDSHGVTFCIDVMECNEWEAAPCGTNATCTNHEGTYACICPPGLVGDPHLACHLPTPAPSPREEVRAGSCSSNSDCPQHNSFCDMEITIPMCRCKPGFFQGSLGLPCQMEDGECNDPRRNNCHRNAICVDQTPGYYCLCEFGYTDAYPGADGTNCRQINECIEGGHDCVAGETACKDRAPPARFECVPTTPLPTPAPTNPPTFPAGIVVTPNPPMRFDETDPVIVSRTPAPILTRSPVAPIPYPAGPYITAANANEKVTIPNPPKPADIPRFDCPHLVEIGLFDWHSASTWGGTIPVSGAAVTLPENMKVIVRDSVNEVLGIVTVPSSSELIFDENNNGITFDAAGFDILGKLIIGSETCRIETPVTITLHGERPDDAVTNVRAPTFKGISVMGEISLHGKRFYRTWTRLAVTVEAGATVLMLQDKVNWMPGQEIVLVTTAMKDSREWHRNEITVVQYVTQDPASGVGTAVVLENPLVYQHVAHSSYQGEVGLLTRAIKIQGDSIHSEPTDPDPLSCVYTTSQRWVYGDRGIPCPNTELTGFGGHIMVHSGGKGYVEGVELYRMGQTNVLGRYPMHFHVLGTGCSDCYFRDSSVHRSFYRCVSIHGTDATQVSENVAYDVMGYCYYLEDGVEQENRIEFNLGAHIHSLGDAPPFGDGQTIPPVPQSDILTLPADITAAAFYITNVHNYIIGNSASGGWAGFAFPNLPTPVGIHRTTVNIRPSSVLGLTIDGNTAHSSSWWWYHAAAFYWGGSLYYEGDTLMYNAGRDQSNSRRTCLVNKCETHNNCGEHCQAHEQAWLQISNSKAYLAPGVGFGSWSGLLEVLGYECHDCGLSLEALSGGFWINNMLSVCRSQTTIALPDSANAAYIRADGFRWYDTGQEHIITQAVFRNCGFRSDEYNQYNQSPTRGCGSETDIGCSPSSSVWSMLTHSDQFVPEMMQGTKAITFQNCGRRFRLADFRERDDNEKGPAPSSVSGREQNWYDLDGTITGMGVRSVAASGLSDAGKWWEVDDEVMFDPQGPLWFFKLDNGPDRGLGHFRMTWDSDLHDKIGNDVCGNGSRQILCESVGQIKHLGEFFTANKGLPITANADVVGPVGGFGWTLELDGGAPKSVQFEEIEVDPATPMLLSIAYPPGITFTLVASSYWCTAHETKYSCSEKFHSVDSVDAVRASTGNTYHVDSNGVLTFRIIQSPKNFIGNPDFFLPQYTDTGRWGRGYAIGRFERDGVLLPQKADNVYVQLETDCPSTDGVYCSNTPASYSPSVCDIGYTQTGYDTCTLDSDSSIKRWSDGSSGSV